MPDHLRILHIEDSRTDALLVARVLKKGGLRFDITRVQSPGELEAALAGDSFDVVLSDYHLPGWNGLEALRRVREARPDLPFLVVSGAVGDDLAVEALRAGAADFRLKTRLPLLVPAIERALADAEARRRSRILADERQRLHRAIQSAPDFVVITDPEATITFANPAAEAQSGYGPGELLGLNLRDLRSGRHDEAFYREIWACLDRGETWRGRVSNKRKDGSIWEAEAAISPVQDGKDGLLGYTVTCRDLTREVMLRLQLEQAQRLEAIGLLAGGIAHDFNNALMPILVIAEVAALRPGTDPRSLEDFRIVTRAAERARDLVRQILGFSRRRELGVQPVELHRVVGEALKLIRSVVPANLTLVEEVDPRNGRVLGDPTHLHQIVLNLMTNAAHAMRHGPGRLRVALDPVRPGAPVPCAVGVVLAPGDYLRLTVADSGDGMGPEVLEQIFRPFFTTKAAGEGTGLGLSIVHSLVQDMGGGIQVVSAPGAGTAFRVFLPLCAEAAAPAPAPDPVVRRPLRVMVVDDESGIVSILEASLAAMGYRVRPCTSALQALVDYLAEPDRFDVVLTDLAMPDLSGLELATAVWALRPRFPVVLITGYAGDLDRERVRGLPFAGVLEKPQSATEVADALEAAVPRESTTR